MDDIRRPYRGDRRDYAIPAQRPHAPEPPNTELSPPAPVHRPAAPAPQPHHVPPAQPLHHQPAHHQSEPHHQPAHHAQPYSTAPAQHHQPAHHPRPAVKKSSRLNINKQVAVAAVLAVAAVFGGWLMLKPDKVKTFTPASLAKQAGFGFYYPSPLPSGYSYVNNINTFQGGQAYYMLGSGSKHIIVHEQPSSGSSLNLATLSNPVTFQAAGGKAAIGNVTGQPAGLVLTGSTLITFNTTGTVAPADLAAAINNLKLVNH